MNLPTYLPHEQDGRLHAGLLDRLISDYVRKVCGDFSSTCTNAAAYSFRESREDLDERTGRSKSFHTLVGSEQRQSGSPATNITILNIHNLLVSIHL